MTDQEATMPEPLAMTLEEAQRRYDAASAELDRICQGPRDKFRMRIPAQRDDSDFILSDALVALRELIATAKAERDVTAELVEALEKISNLNRHRTYTSKAAHATCEVVDAALAAVGEGEE